MTIKGRNPATIGAAIPDDGAMRGFARIGALLFDHGLPRRPDVYDLLWRYVRDENHLLSLAVDRAIAVGRLDLGTVGDLRRTHCSDISAEDVSALIKAAHDQAEALSRHVEGGGTDLGDFGRAIAGGGARLAVPLDAPGLALLLEQFGAATATMQAATARLEGELATTVGEARALADKLVAAERAAIIGPLTGVLNRRGRRRQPRPVDLLCRCHRGPPRLRLRHADRPCRPRTLRRQAHGA